MILGSDLSCSNMLLIEVGLELLLRVEYSPTLFAFGLVFRGHVNILSTYNVVGRF
jgi:hypothetical protein